MTLWSDVEFIVPTQCPSICFDMTRAAPNRSGIGAADHSKIIGSTMTLLLEERPRATRGVAAKTTKVILVRHGKPAIPTNPRTSHHGFRRYIDAYQDAGLDPQSAPPEELLDLVKGLNAVSTSGLPRADDSARSLLLRPRSRRSTIRRSPTCRAANPAAQDEGAGLAVMARIMWHAGYHPGDRELSSSEGARVHAADILLAAQTPMTAWQSWWPMAISMR